MKIIYTRKLVATFIALQKFIAHFQYMFFLADFIFISHKLC